MENRTEQIRDLLILCVDTELPKRFTVHKRLAIMRYMKTYIRAMATYELEEFARLAKAGISDLPDAVAFKVNQASKGYDAFMARRGVRAK